MTLFRYSGNKSRMLKHLPRPPWGYHIVEPFAGSAAYSMSFANWLCPVPSIHLAEANSDVRGLLEWIRTGASVEELTALEAMRPTENIDVRELKLHPAAETLMRLTASGLYVGQLSAYRLYAQHSIDFSWMKAHLPMLQRQMSPVLSDFRETIALDNGTKLFFVDPPYLGTKGNYIDKSAKGEKDLTGPVDISSIREFVLGLKSPVVFTYGDDAPEVFPEFEWKVAMVKRTSRARVGGVVERREYWTKRNF